MLQNWPPEFSRVSDWIGAGGKGIYTTYLHSLSQTDHPHRSAPQRRDPHKAEQEFQKTLALPETWFLQ